MDLGSESPVQLDFLRFAREMATQHLSAVPEERFDIDWGTYAKGANRPKAYLEKIRSSVEELSRVKVEAACFIKDECYAEIKYPRTIAALPFETMAIMSPVTKVLETELFVHSKLAKYFVKKIPVCNRPAKIEELFGEDAVVLGDFSSFECHHRGVFAKAVKFVFFRLLGDNGSHKIREAFSSYLTGHNSLKFKKTGIKATIQETLMSGAPWTSFANATLCFLIVSYLRLRDKFPDDSPKILASRIASFKGLVEGDDSITAGRAYNVGLIAGLQVKLKSEVHAHCGTASFCGIIKPPRIDAVLTDPVKVVCNFFHLPKVMIGVGEKKQRSYLRSKALSYYYQYRTCPVVAHLCEAVLKRTAGVHVINSHLTYHREEVLKEALSKGDKFWKREPEVCAQSRHMVAELFHLQVGEQLQLEEFFRNFGLGKVNQNFQFGPVFDKYVRNGILCLSPRSDPSTSHAPNTREFAHDRGRWIDPSQLASTSTKQASAAFSPTMLTVPNFTAGLQ